ncbi:tlde1 domain-containing protein [Jiella marina]|uniref:tlde1 domain-containing protein n=1 Tax=Jiella sp. LLJ827 TaxID=2917712 RepID=UPI0021012ED0|nr:tlde1 domain-containing protein [Jiella sp. LLJ827]MCQ0989831.1 DUF2778 domain-containing protein [Jiella sp. LLJ827]
MTARDFEGNGPAGPKTSPRSQGLLRRALWGGAIALSAMAAIGLSTQIWASDPSSGSAEVELAAADTTPITIALRDAAASPPTYGARNSNLTEPTGLRAGERPDPGHELAERGGRVYRPDAAGSASQAAQPDAADALSQVADLPEPSPEAKAPWGSIPKELEAQVAAETVSQKPAKPRPARQESEPSGQGALAQLAAFNPKPSLREKLEGTGVAAFQSPTDNPRPSLRAEIEAAAATQADELGEEDLLAAIPLPEPRPEASESEGVQVASLEPQDGPNSLGTAVEEMTALAVPLPTRRPDYSPPVAAQPDEPTRQPASRQAPRRAPDVASTRPQTPGNDNSSGGIGSFFKKLFKGDVSKKLPHPSMGIAVYDISAQAVYLPGGEELEAHSGLGHMKDDPRYVNQKNRGPTPPNIYNLRMREALFHGAEAVRLLPADGRKKYNRDGLLAHPYMYVRGGGNDKSMSNGCMTVKEYERFLNAFKRGQIKRLIVVSSLRDLPTYMAAL